MESREDVGGWGGGGVCRAGASKWVHSMAKGVTGLLTLGLTVVHAILASQRLNQAFQRLISFHIVAVPNAALNLHQHKQLCVRLKLVP